MGRLACALFVFMLGCSHSPTRPSPATSQPPTCVVLSVGSMKGVAEIGALIALRDAGVRIDCVAGNSMGSLVGGLYASAPNENLVDRFRQFRDGYVARTKDDKIGGGILGALIVGAMTGGAGLAMLAGGAIGADSVEEIDRDRVVTTLDAVFDQVDIEKLPVPYATFYQEKSGDGVQVVVARSGNLAQSIGRSIANPFIFKKLDVVAAGQMDPGGDRLSAVPIDDACKAFPGHRLIAINVTGQPSVHTSTMNCVVDEITIDVGSVQAEALFSSDDRELERVVMIGWKATAQRFGLPAEPAKGMAAMTGARRK